MFSWSVWESYVAKLGFKLAMPRICNLTCYLLLMEPGKKNNKLQHKVLINMSWAMRKGDFGTYLNSTDHSGNIKLKSLQTCTNPDHPVHAQSIILAEGLGGSVWCAVRLETRRSRVQPPPRSATFFRGDGSWNIFYGHSLPSAVSRRAVVSFWWKNVHILKGLSLPSKRVVR